jgi:hypothetical protein
MTYEPHVANVLSVYNSADAASLREGLSWYLDAHRFAQAQAIEHGITVAQAAGVIAALSPMMGWDSNKAQAITAFTHGTAMGLGLDRNCVKATRILIGEVSDPLAVLRGDKVTAFYRTILNPTGDIDPVIDRHAFDVAVGAVTDESARSALGRKGVYQAFANVYREAAIVAGIGSAQMQAVTWVAWRKAKA